MATRNLGNFAIEEEIGRGGMGVVYLGRQKTLDRPAVLKKLRRDLAQQRELVKRFEREARAAARVHHQNVVAVYDCFEHRSEHWIALEYIDGTDLQAALKKVGPLPSRIAALIGLEVVRGLEAIHANGTVHRDLKPANILLGRAGEVKIADFGIALEATGSSLTQPGMMLGSLSYMPPEQMLGDRVDARGDLFSFGIVLYQMLAGEAPYAEPTDGEGEETLLARIQRERYPSLRGRAPRVWRGLRRIVRASLRARPRQRVQSAAELRRMLERRLRRPSPADCRAEIAAWLWEQNAFPAPKGGATTVSVAPRRRQRRRRAWLRPPAWIATAAIWLLAASLVLIVEGNPASFASDRGHLWVVAPRGATVRIDGAPAVPAPHFVPLELSPGRHRLVFAHPDHGTVTETVRVSAGDQALLEPAFPAKK